MGTIEAFWLNPLRKAEGEHELNININREVVKMLELIDRSPVLQRMAWAVIWLAGAALLIHAIRWW